MRIGRMSGFPSSRGGVPERINRSLESEGGVVAHRDVSQCVFSTLCLSDHPVCGASERGLFIDAAATPPLEEGSCCMRRNMLTRLRRTAIVAFVLHLIAGASMALILRHGLETNPDLQ